MADPVESVSGARGVLRAHGLPVSLVAPAILVLAVGVLYPVLFNLFAGLHRWNLLEGPTPQAFIGLSGIARALGDPVVWHALAITLVITVVAVAVEFVLGLGLALLVSEEIHAGRLMRTLLVAPIMATPLVVALIFRLMWHGEFGVFNHGLSLFGLGPVVWLAGPATALFAILVTEIWHNTSFVFLVLLGALQMLPKEPFEAALIDGADAWQRFRHVTLPLLKPAILVALLFRVVFAIRLFDEIWVLTRGGPNGATESMSILLYHSAFEDFDIDRAAVLSLILLVVAGLLAFLMIRTLYARKDPA